MKFKPTHTRGKILVELNDKELLPTPSSSLANLTSRSFSLKRILVPIDFSEGSKRALAYAVPYAKEFGAKITLLYVAQFSWVGSEKDSAEVPDLEKRVTENARAKLMELAKELPDDVENEVVVTAGRPFQEIIVAAETLRSDLIIIATEGAHRDNSYLGSTAERVVRHANCPVLIVRQQERDFVTIPSIQGKQSAGLAASL